MSFDHVAALVILVPSLMSAAIKTRSLLGTLRSAAQWEAGSSDRLAGFHLRAKAAPILEAP